jgi:xylulokinase
VIEGQQMALARHSRWMNVRIDTIYATGGAAANREILQVMADVFGADVYQLLVGNSAALGAALRALHGARADTGRPAEWDDVVRDLAEPVTASRLRPRHEHRALYDGLMEVHAACEAHALGRGPDPADRIARFTRAFATPV